MQRPWGREGQQGESREYTRRLVGGDTERGEDRVGLCESLLRLCFHPDERKEAVGWLLVRSDFWFYRSLSLGC